MAEAEMVKTVKRNKTVPKALVAVALVLVGAIIMVAIRFATAKNPNVHYHANFALYVNGQQDQFQGPGYYEEVTVCDAHDHNNLQSRVHMHDNINSVVHVHDHSVSWADFFNNLGYTLGDKVLVTEKGTYVDGQDGNKLSFMLNGQAVDGIANRIIGDEDVLLINYGQDDAATLQSRYNTIPKDAHHYDVTKDPAACSGGSFSTWDRLKSALGVPSSSS